MERYLAKAFSESKRVTYVISVGPNKIRNAAIYIFLVIPTINTAIKTTVTNVNGANINENINALKKISLAVPIKLIITG